MKWFLIILLIILNVFLLYVYVSGDKEMNTNLSMAENMFLKVKEVLRFAVTANTAANDTSLVFLTSLTPQSHFINVSNSSSINRGNLTVSFSSITVGGFDIYLNNVLVGNVTTSDSSPKAILNLASNIKGGNNNITYNPEVLSTGTITETNISYDYGSDSPLITFVNPTPTNATTQSANAIYVNFTSNDTSNHYTFVDFDKSLLLWMTMDDLNSTGNPIDLSTYSNNGTLGSGAVINKTGYFGNGSSYDGVDDFINIADSAGLRMANGGTFNMWINPRTIGEGSAGRILDKSTALTGANGYIVLITTNNVIQLVVNATNTLATGSNAVTLNKWNFVSTIFNSTGKEIYVNGIRVANASTTNLASDIAGAVRIGNRAGATDRTFNGSIDEVIIFNRSLSTAEILSLYNSTVNQYSNNFTNLDNAPHTMIGYSVDALGYRNQTDYRTIQIAPVATDTCTYSSGNWAVLCQDNCTVNTNVAINTGSNISITGSGAFITNANITGWNKLTTTGANSTNICRVRSNLGGGFRK